MKMTCWTEAEDCILREHYHERGAAWVAARLGRGVYGVKSRAQRIGCLPVRSAEDSYQRILIALRADAAEHGKPSPTRVARDLEIPCTSVVGKLSEARKRGDMPPTRMSTIRGEWEAGKGAGSGLGREPTPEQVAEVERLYRIERDAKVAAEPRHWSVPIVARPRRAAR